MRIALQDLLSEKPILLADGATGTNFMDMGLEPGFPPDLWNLTQPQKPESLHQMFVDAGSDIILTNTFGANAPRLKLHGAEDDTYEINKAGARIAGTVAANCVRPVVVAGSVGPTGELLVPVGDMTIAGAIAAFSEQIRGLKDGGVDVIWIETMSSEEEILAASLAAIKLDMPFVFTASFDTAGKTMMGLAPSALAKLAASLPQMPVAYGANCGVGASDLLMSVQSMTQTDPQAIIVGKANCGIPIVKGKTTVYTGTPELMADYVEFAANSGVRIIGGCCGTSPVHIRAMRKALDDFEETRRPDLDDIINTIGPLVAPPFQGDLDARARGRKAKKRRKVAALTLEGDEQYHPAYRGYSEIR